MTPHDGFPKTRWTGRPRAFMLLIPCFCRGAISLRKEGSKASHAQPARLLLRGTFLLRFTPIRSGHRSAGAGAAPADTLGCRPSPPALGEGRARSRAARPVRGCEHRLLQPKIETQAGVTVMSGHWGCRRVVSGEGGRHLHLAPPC